MVDEELKICEFARMSLSCEIVQFNNTQNLSLAGQLKHIRKITIPLNNRRFFS